MSVLESAGVLKSAGVLESASVLESAGSFKSAGILKSAGVCLRVSWCWSLKVMVIANKVGRVFCVPYKFQMVVGVYLYQLYLKSIPDLVKES